MSFILKWKNLNNVKQSEDKSMRRETGPNNLDVVENGNLFVGRSFKEF